MAYSIYLGDFVMKKLVWIFLFFTWSSLAVAADKILIVSTSYSKLGNTGEKTGLWLSEASHPYTILTDAGYEVDIASVKGGRIPIDPNSTKEHDDINQSFLNEPNSANKLSNSLALKDVSGKDYIGVIFSGGHGSVWDFYPNTDIARIGTQMQKNNGVIAAVCHGVSALLSIKDLENNSIIKGKEIAGFSNSEERAIKLEKTVPFMLQDALEKQGAKYESGENFTAFVKVDGNIITGQNPQSSSLLAKEILKKLKK